jgi:hypothetical protein
MILLRTICLMFVLICNLFKSSISLIPAKTIKGSQPPMRVLHGQKFRTPTGFSIPVRSRRPTSTSTTVVYASTGTDDGISSMRAGEIKKELESYGISTVSFVEKSELVKALEKARADGLKPKSTTTTTTASSSSSSSSSSDTDSKSTKKKKRPSADDDEEVEEDSRPREERLIDELVKCQAMKAGEMRKELEGLGVSTKSFFEKTDFVKALADARVDGVGVEKEGYAEYSNVEVLTDDASGPRPPASSQKEEQKTGGGGGSPFGGGASPFGGGGGGASPFGGGGMPGGMSGGSGMGGMGGIADMLKNMGGGGGAAAGGGGNPFGGMGGDAMGKAQELMKNPKVMQLMMKAQGNPKIMAAMQECMSNPAAFAKYQNDPEVAELLKELQKVM